MYETIYTKYGQIQLGNEFIHIEDDQYRRDMRRMTLSVVMGGADVFAYVVQGMAGS